MAKRSRARKSRKSGNGDGLIVGLGAGCIGFFVLVKLAVLAGGFYLAWLLVSWLITK